MLRTAAFAALCFILAVYAAFRVDDAYTTFASDMPDPARTSQIVTHGDDPISEADAYALAQTAPAAGGRYAVASRRPFRLPSPPPRRDEKELLELLSRTDAESR